MKLRTRVTLTLTTVTSLVLGASFVVALQLVERDEARDFDATLSAQAFAAARVGGDGDEEAAAHEGTARVPESIAPVAKYVAIYGADGQRRSSTQNFGAAAPESLVIAGLQLPLPREGARLDLDVAGQPVRAIAVPFAPGRVLVFGLAHAAIASDVLFLRRVFGVLFLSALAITILVARWLGEKLSADVNAIAVVARDVAAGDLARRVGSVATGSNETQSLAEDLDRMIERLGELVTAQRTFVSHASHELRSPLTTLRGELQLALRRPRDRGGYKEAIEHALREVEDLSVLAEDLLSLARAQGTAKAIGSSALSDVVADALRAAEGSARTRGVRLIAPTGTSLADAVRGAQRDLARALRNLVDNAVAHTADGGEVRIAAQRTPDAVEIAVEDDGPGVDASDAVNLFAPFWRGAIERAGENGGAGLGLSIAREIARATGGDITVDTSRRHGARFVLRMPVA